MTEDTPFDPSDGTGLGRFREYLRVIAEVQTGKVLAPRLDASDIVQETLLRAHRAHEEMRGMSEDDCIAWLRRILTNTLASAIRDNRRDKRDLRREVCLARGIQSAEDNTLAIATTLSSPSARLRRSELLLSVANALTTLPEEHREVILLRYLHSQSVDQIADELERTRAAVAGLLRRGMTSLRRELNRATNGHDG